MCRRHERTIGVSLVFMVVLVVWAVSAETCDDLQCLNSNPCQSFVKHDKTIHSRCVCGGQWAGRRCQHQIRLQPQDVTSSQARLKVEVMRSRRSDVTSSSRGSSAMSLVLTKEGEVMLNYTLVYWRRNDTLTSLALDSSFLTSGAVTCVLLHKRNSREPVLEGLLPSTRYTICVENGFIDSCVLSSFTQSSSPSSSLPSSVSQWPSNCVTIYTPKTSPPRHVITKSSTVTVVAVVSVFILTLLVVVFVVFLLRRHNVAFRLLMDSVCGKCCCLSCTCCGHSGGHTSQDRTRLSHSSSQISRTTFIDDDSPRDNGTCKRPLLKWLRPCQKKPKSSTYTSANMLLAPPPSSNPADGFSHSESLPLGFDLIDDDCVFDNSPSEQPAAVAALPALRGGRNKPRHRLSRKRRGYVAYSTRKDKNIRLTTVLESPIGDDDDDFCESFLGCGHSSI